MSLVEHLEKLRHFAKLTNYRSINEGSQGMGISQAGLSKSISSLENVLDTKLFNRSNEGLILTKEGQLVLETTRKILADAAALETNLRSLRASEIPKKMTIGMYDSIAIYFFPDLAAYIKAIYPSVELNLVVDNSSKLAERMAKGQLEFAIGANLQDFKGKSEFFLLFEDHYSFYVEPKAASRLPELPLIFHPTATDVKGKTIEENLTKLAKAKSAHRVFNFETIKTLTTLGLGVGIMPTQVAKPLVRSSSLVTVTMPRHPHLFGQHTIGFLISNSFLSAHEDFARDIHRLGERWAKS